MLTRAMVVSGRALRNPVVDWSASRFLALCLAACLVSVPASAEIDGTGLKAFHQWIKIRHRSVKHVSAEELDALRKRLADDLLVLDVREVGEHAVSRIEGSVRVTPGIDTTKFLKRFGGNLKGKTVVLYCSVGARSSSLAARVQKSARAAGAVAIYNLSGGIFNWHNQSRKLRNASGSTELVHPFSPKWSTMLTHRDRTSYRPAEPGSQ